MTVRQMKRVEVPEVPDVPGMQEELNRRRSRHFSAGGLESNIEMQSFRGIEQMSAGGACSAADSFGKFCL